MMYRNARSGTLCRPLLSCSGVVASSSAGVTVAVVSSAPTGLTTPSTKTAIPQSSLWFSRTSICRMTVAAAMAPKAKPAMIAVGMA